MTRLRDLDPKLQGTMENGVLSFDCPFPGHTHRQYVRIHAAPFGKVSGENVWQASGAFPDSVTVLPSINADTPSYPCWHGWVTNGEVT